MVSEMSMIFSRMIGTLAVILVVSAFIGSSDIMANIVKSRKNWKYVAVIGVLGGVFGIYGNISGFGLSGAVISV